MINGTASSIAVRIPVAFLMTTVLQKGLIGLGLTGPIVSVTSILVSIIHIRMNSSKEANLI